MVVVPVHPAAVVPVMVYVVVAVGLAVTLEPVVALKPVAGDHVYVKAPDAVKVVLDPLQIVAGATVTSALAFTVMVDVVDETQPAALVPVMVYVVVEAGLAVTVVPVVALSPVAGDHAYVDAPLAVNGVLVPVQMVVDGTLTIGNGFTVTVTVPVFTHPAALVPVIVYVVVAVGLAVTLAPVVALNPVAGDHAYVDAPLAVSIALAPSQIVAGAHAITGNGFTVTVAVVVPVHPAAVVPVIV